MNVFILVLLHSNKNENKITITFNIKDEYQKQHWLKVLETGVITTRLHFYTIENQCDKTIL